MSSLQMQLDLRRTLPTPPQPPGAAPAVHSAEIPPSLTQPTRPVVDAPGRTGTSALLADLASLRAREGQRLGPEPGQFQVPTATMRGATLRRQLDTQTLQLLAHTTQLLSVLTAQRHGTPAQHRGWLDFRLPLSLARSVAASHRAMQSLLGCLLLVLNSRQGFEPSLLRLCQQLVLSLNPLLPMLALPMEPPTPTPPLPAALQKLVNDLEQLRQAFKTGPRTRSTLPAASSPAASPFAPPRPQALAQDPGESGLAAHGSRRQARVVPAQQGPARPIDPMDPAPWINPLEQPIWPQRLNSKV